MNKRVIIIFLSLLGCRGFGVDSSAVSAALAVNALGIDLLPKAGNADSNVLISPYSIQCAMAMTWAGADGVTLTEMQKALHYEGEEIQVHLNFSSLRKMLDDIEKVSVAAPIQSREHSSQTNDPIRLISANRLFGQKGFTFRPQFLALTREVYDAPLCELDFKGHSEEAARLINGWVEETTQNRIRELIGPKSLNQDNRLIVVNVIYLKAPWQKKFTSLATRYEVFHLNRSNSVEVPTMWTKQPVSYAKREGYTMIGIPYVGRSFQFLILLPDDVEGLAKLEKELTLPVLAEGAHLPACEANIYIPRLSLEPPLLKLKDSLLGLGMKTAFDEPRGSANFNRMAPCTSDKYLFVSDVFHKAFLKLDEDGTEAVAATTVMVRSGGLPNPATPEARIDRPFLFAVQHRASGACLFLGRVTDPRFESSTAR